MYFQQGTESFPLKMAVKVTCDSSNKYIFQKIKYVESFPDKLFNVFWDVSTNDF